MSRIRWVCLSDLHLGALNSVLTSVTPDGVQMDASTPSPVLEALAACLRALRTPGQDPPELVVLGDLFELALTAPEDAAATFAQLVLELSPGAANGAVAPTVRFVPGNHDHHLWSRARDQRDLELMTTGARTIPRAQERHATHLVPANDAIPVRDRFIEVLAQRADPSTAMTVVQSYPNLGLVDAGGRRSVVLNHGHFIEPLYRMMSQLGRLFGAPDAGPAQAWQLEADNGGWIDFFWSSMGDSGDVMAVTRSLYESLQSHEAIHAEIEVIERAVREAGRSRVEADVEAHALATMLSLGVGAVLRERHRTGAVLSERAEAGLLQYLTGPVGAQVAAEIGRPEELTFVFGHTHKPFVDQREVHDVPEPVHVVNTGGWVVDTPERTAIKGAAIVVIDEDMNVAALCCYHEGPDPDAYQVRIEPADPSRPNPLAEELASIVDAGRDPWAGLAQAIRSTVEARARQLAERLSSVADEDRPAADAPGGAAPRASRSRRRAANGG